jgi:hypothetical protein
MEQLIEQFKLRKAQLAGAIMDEQKQPIVNWDIIKICEVQAELYDSMIALAEAFNHLTQQ